MEASSAVDLSASFAPPPPIGNILMAKPPSLLESLAQMARQKHEAARARHMADHGAEKPREIILTACSAIADQLSKDGFSFLKSGPKLKRKARDLTHNIHFQSDRNNVAGRRAAMWIHASVSSDIMARWRLENPMPWNGTHKPSLAIITGGQIGNLLPNSSWMEWNFADISDALHKSMKQRLPSGRSCCRSLRCSKRRPPPSKH